MMHFRPPFKWIVLALGLVTLSGWGITAEIGDLSTTDASNTARFPEGRAAGLTNDNLRALEGLLARGLKDTIDGVLTSTGSTTALNVTANRTGATSLYTGLSFRMLAHTSIGNNAALTFNSVSSAALTWPNGTALKAGDITMNQIAELVYSDSKWRLMGGRGSPYARAFTTSTSAFVIATDYTIPRDGTTPQITEGYQIMSATITPTGSGNNIHINAVIQANAQEGVDMSMVCALFRNGVSNALTQSGGTVQEGVTGENEDHNSLVIMWEEPASNTDGKTYSVRCGPSNTVNALMIINGYYSSFPILRYGGSNATTMTVEEVPAP